MHWPRFPTFAFAATLTAFGWSPAAPAAEPGRFRFDLPAGPLGPAVAALAQQSGASIGLPERLPTVRVRALHGRMTADRALERLLAGSGLRAVRAGPVAWRILSPPPPRSPGDPDPLPPIAAEEIVVSATKQPMSAGRVPAAIEIVGGPVLARLGDAPDAANISVATNGLFVTNLGSGRDRLFIRGVADSPFDGFGQSSVAVQIGEARATYDAPDPDIRLVDMAQVELLKGPQGPLYGSGALGGVYRVTPAAPDPGRIAASVRGGIEATAGGALAGNADAMVNLPLIADTVAVRAVGYRLGQSGWIDEGTRHDVNHGRTTGGRLSLRAGIGSWTVDALALDQSSEIADSQYVESAHSLSRAPRMAEPQDTDFSLGTITAAGPIGTLRATVTGSMAWQQLAARYDASARAAVLGGAAPAAFDDTRHYRVATAEARIAGEGERVDWLAGLSLLDAHTRAQGSLGDSGGMRQVLRVDRDADEYAAFGELTARLTDRLTGSAGLRVYRNTTNDTRSEVRSQTKSYGDTAHVSPSASLAWRAGSWLAYARFSSALRPGGVAAPLAGETTGSRYAADRLSAFDLGGRWQSEDGRYSIDSAIFGSRWLNVQADYLTSSGLVTTRNAGDASNVGVDTTLGWRATPRLTLSGGVLVQRPRIDAADTSGGAADRRLPIVPDLAAHAELLLGGTLRGWDYGLSLRARYVGEVRLSFDPGLDRQSDALATLSASASVARDGWAFRFGIDNIGNSRADSFAFGNPFSVADTPQHTPVRPRTVTLSLRRSW